jgi:hypothetical protein
VTNALCGADSSTPGSAIRKKFMSNVSHDTVRRLDTLNDTAYGPTPPWFGAGHGNEVSTNLELVDLLDEWASGGSLAEGAFERRECTGEHDVHRVPDRSRSLVPTDEGGGERHCSSEIVSDDREQLIRRPREGARPSIERGDP